MQKSIVPLVIVSIVLLFAISPAGAVETDENIVRHPPTLEVFQTDAIDPVVDNWTAISFDSLDVETSFDGAYGFSENDSNIVIYKDGIYTLSGVIHIQNSTDVNKDNIIVLLRAKKRIGYLRDTQREIEAETFKSRREESLSFSSVEYFEEGDNIELEYWTNKEGLVFISDKRFSENIAASFSISRLSYVDSTSGDLPKIVEDKTSSVAYLGFLFGMISLVLVLLVANRRWD